MAKAVDINVDISVTGPKWQPKLGDIAYARPSPKVEKPAETPGTGSVLPHGPALPPHHSLFAGNPGDPTTPALKEVSEKLAPSNHRDVSLPVQDVFTRSTLVKASKLTVSDAERWKKVPVGDGEVHLSLSPDQRYNFHLPDRTVSFLVGANPDGQPGIALTRARTTETYTGDIRPTSPEDLQKLVAHGVIRRDLLPADSGGAQPYTPHVSTDHPSGPVRGPSSGGKGQRIITMLRAVLERILDRLDARDDRPVRREAPARSERERADRPQRADDNPVDVSGPIETVFQRMLIERLLELDIGERFQVNENINLYLSEDRGRLALNFELGDRIVTIKLTEDESGRYDLVSEGASTLHISSNEWSATTANEVERLVEAGLLHRSVLTESSLRAGNGNPSSIRERAQRARNSRNPSAPGGPDHVRTGSRTRGVSEPSGVDGPPRLEVPARDINVSVERLFGEDRFEFWASRPGETIDIGGGVRVRYDEDENALRVFKDGVVTDFFLEPPGSDERVWVDMIVQYDANGDPFAPTDADLVDFVGPRVLSAPAIQILEPQSDDE